jgi:hypothetical protein
MDDEELHLAISALVDEEKDLRQSHKGRAISPEQQQRLAALEVRLDQLWDLLRRREAREEFGGNPDAESERPSDVVEHYRQ